MHDLPSSRPSLSPGSEFCPRPSQILEFMQHGLAAPEAAQFEAHIDACPVCCELLAELARLDDSGGGA